MKYLLIISAIALNLSASIYYAKVEPRDTYSIKATASGEVVSLHQDSEGKISSGGVLIQLDDILNKKELVSSNLKLKSLNTTLELTQKNIKNLKEVEKIRENNYQRIKDLKTKSRVEKDNDLINFLNAGNQVLTLETSAQNLLVTIADLEYKIAVLEDTIRNKAVKIKNGFLIYKTYVNVGDYVNVGAQLVDAYDVSKAKLTLFVSKEDVALAQNGVVYVNDQPSAYTVSKIWKVVDTQNISSYRTEIVIKAPERFSELLKIEFKEK